MLTHRVGGGVVGGHLRLELGVKVRAPVHGARRGAMGDDGNDVEGDGAHIDEHARDVDERREKEDALTA